MNKVFDSFDAAVADISDGATAVLSAANHAAFKT